MSLGAVSRSLSEQTTTNTWKYTRIILGSTANTLDAGRSSSPVSMLRWDIFSIQDS
jgi:hypothetical protein